MMTNICFLYTKLKQKLLTNMYFNKIQKNAYRYQLKNKNLTFSDAVEILEERFKNNIKCGQINNQSQKDIENVLGKLKKLGINAVEVEIDKSEYDTYIKKADYKWKYPKYYPDNFAEKSFEHFLSQKFLKLLPGEVFVDIASERSPLSKIFTRLFGCNSYSQDIMFPEGINGNQIGGDAAKIPVKDEFFDAAIATCSIEHFEGDADKLFMKEMGRTLKKGGKIVIAPLYLYSKPACQTDPVYAVNGDVQFDHDSTIHLVENWGNRHGRFYSPETLMERLINVTKEINFTVYYIKNPWEISKTIYCRYMLLGEKAI